MKYNLYIKYWTMQVMEVDFVQGEHKVTSQLSRNVKI